MWSNISYSKSLAHLDDFDSFGNFSVSFVFFSRSSFLVGHVFIGWWFYIAAVIKIDARMYRPQWKCVKMLAIYMVKPNKRAFSTQFKIENRQTKKYAILSLNGLFFWAKLKHSIYETENDVIIWIADVAVATGCGGYSLLACLLERSVEFSYRCRDYDGRWVLYTGCALLAVGQILL